MTPVSIPWQHRTVSTQDGARLAAYVLEPEHPDHDTPTMLLAHGWTLDHRSWDSVVTRLAADEDVRVVTWDQRGHGESTLKQGRFRPGGESVRALGDDMFTVLEALVPQESQVVIAGHSMGGMTVMAFAGLHPDLLGTRIKAAVLVATAASNLRGLGVPGEALAMKLTRYLPFRTGRLVRAQQQRRVGFGDNARDEDVLAATAQIAGTRLSTSGAYYAALMAHDETAALAALSKVPVTILSGTRDKLTPPKYSREMAEAMPTAALQSIDGGGHMLMYEVPETVHAALRKALEQAR